MLQGDAGQGGALAHELVDAVARERPAGPAGPGRLEQGRFPVAAVPGELEVFVQRRERGRVDRHGPGLRALSADPEVRHAPVLVERSDGEAGDLIAPEPVVEEDGKKRPVAPAAEPGPSDRSTPVPCPRGAAQVCSCPDVTTDNVFYQ